VKRVASSDILITPTEAGQGGGCEFVFGLDLNGLSRLYTEIYTLQEMVLVGHVARCIVIRDDLLGAKSLGQGPQTQTFPR
jgi:hypothetical protein